MAEDVVLDPNEIVDMFNEISEAEKSRAPKGEKANQIRADIRYIIKVVKKDKISLATLRKMVLSMMQKRAIAHGIPEDEVKDKESKNYVGLEQSQFTGIVTKTWKTENVAGTVIIDVSEELDPKVQEPKKHTKGKTKPVSNDDLDADLG